MRIFHQSPQAGRPHDVLDALARARPARLDADHPPAVTWPDARTFTEVAAARFDPVSQDGPGLDARRFSVPGRRRLVAALSSAAAIVIVVAILVAAGPLAGRDRRPQPGGSSSPSASASPSPSLPPMSARAALLMTAAHVPHTAVGGRYWYSAELTAWIGAGGTRKHPYDIAVPDIEKFWLSPKAGQRDYYFTEQLAARPATPADRLQWQAAGSPASWGYGIKPGTTGPTRRYAAFWAGKGTTGYLEGDLPYLTERQFLSLPTAPHALLRVLRKEAGRLWSVRHPGSGGATMSQIVWTELMQLVRGPDGWQVRQAAWRIIAGRPGLRSLGPMRDPLGRPGYGVITGGLILVLDPAAGSLLATEQVGTPAGWAWNKPLPAGRTHYCPRGGNVSTFCVPLYFHRVYRGQLSSWHAFLGQGWTSAAPKLPVAPVRNDEGY